MNPFIEVAKDPVATLGYAGYALLLLALLVWTLGVCWSNVLVLLTRWHDERPREWEYAPPLSFISRAGLVPFILFVDAWAVAALIWLIG